MKLIKHILLVRLNEETVLMVNTLNGLADEMCNATFETIEKWQKSDCISPRGEFEASLFESLKSRGYMVADHGEEIELKYKMFEMLRKRDAMAKGIRNSITFILTYDCNFGCKYCFEGAGGSNPSKPATFTSEMIDAAIKLSGNELKAIALFGGEPLLPKNRDAIERIISRVPHIVYSVTTNGYYLEEFAELLSKVNVSDIVVTLDGEEETHNRRRHLKNGKPTFRKIMSGMEKCLELGLPVCIRMNIDNENKGEFDGFRKRLQENYRQYGDKLSFNIAALMPGTICPDERNEILDIIYRSNMTRTEAENEKERRQLSVFNNVVGTLISGERLKPMYTFCQAHDNGFTVDPYGYVYTCPSAIGVEELAIGRFYPTIEFKEKSIRTRNVETIPECRDCVYTFLCGGGCPMSLGDYSDIDRPECKHIKNQMHNILPAYWKVQNEKVCGDKRDA